jgi:hypothetical protein
MNDARLISIAAQIEACGSDQLKLTALANSLREEANPPVADETDNGAVDLTPRKPTKDAKPHQKAKS